MSRGTYFFNIECFETVTHVGVHLATILLPQLLECWDSRNPPPRLAKGAFFIFKGGFTILRDHHASPALSPGGLGGGSLVGATRPSPTGAFLLAQPSPSPPAIGCRERDTHWPVLQMTPETHVGAAGAHWLACPANRGRDRPVPRLRGGQSDLRWTEQSQSGLPVSAFPSLLLERRQGRGSLRAFEPHFAKGGYSGTRQT